MRLPLLCAILERLNLAQKVIFIEPRLSSSSGSRDALGSCLRREETGLCVRTTRKNARMSDKGKDVYQNGRQEYKITRDTEIMRPLRPLRPDKTGPIAWTMTRGSVLLMTEAVIRTKEREWIHASRIKRPVDEPKEWTITSEPGDTKLTLKRGLGGNELGRPKWSKKHTQDHT
ncbi:hypothetical protein DUI87_19004 [Hirundo rustica rustica]|uniref:Murine leukemia virus integrase C-terminal domain-containing protein n=1 Tax=Hirundo rustica rustica TaxID=333673 RepID=A0A3M0JTY8_HIRRU|nr:hypothetical protein DUI87_19004 [Hirundo rustica rustica]